MGIKIKISPEVGIGKYTNFAITRHTNLEFVIDFVSNLPDSKPEVHSRIIMSPACAKGLIAALQTTLLGFEEKFGEIKVPSKEESYIIDIPTPGPSA